MAAKDANENTKDAKGAGKVPTAVLHRNGRKERKWGRE